ncbi:microsomal epoxide hydrolase [Xylariomycetidae sp. FL2044]|nr:microsomal epoxide hydrolase [Xylariomycetidae sp. FL2044]
MSEEIKPYKIAVPDAALSDLIDRLRRTRLPSERSPGRTEVSADPEEQRWAAGTPLSEVSPRDDAVPLLFKHGWPGSFLEGVKLIKPLTEPPSLLPRRDPLSLPSYGFSTYPSQRGFGIKHCGRVLHTLMVERLGYERYAVAAGGGWGWFVARAMGIEFGSSTTSSSSIGAYLTPDHYPAPSLTKSPPLLYRATPPREKAGMERAAAIFYAHSHGYGAIQSTRPQTLAYAKLVAWSVRRLTLIRRRVCAPGWVSVYWFSAAGPAASFNLYYEFAQAHRPEVFDTEALQRWNGDVPLGLAYFPADVFNFPGLWGRALGPVVFEREHERGDHFPGWEVPELVAEDLRVMFGK